MVSRTSRTARRGSRGFTIIELLIVVIVIGILAAAGIGKYQGFAENARSKACCSNISVIENAIAMWTTQNTALNETAQGAQWFRRDGHSSSHGWATPPPFSDTWQISNVIRDNNTFICPKILQGANNDVGTVCNSWACQPTLNGQNFNNCWAGNYVFYYNGPNVGGTWNGGHWWDVSGTRNAHQIVFCAAFGLHACNGFLPAQFKHSVRWRDAYN